MIILNFWNYSNSIIIVYGFVSNMMRASNLNLIFAEEPLKLTDQFVS
jgi:hypothetical protein